MTGPRIASEKKIQPTTKFGNVALSERQITLCILVTQNCSNEEIAGYLKTTKHMVKKWLFEIFEATGMSNRLELAVWAMQWIVKSLTV